MAEDSENICRACLSFDGSFYPMKAHGLDYLFQQVTGLQANEDERLPSALCEKCSKELRSYQQFQVTSKQSNDLLYDVLGRFQYISKDLIKSIKEENIKPCKDKNFKLKDEQTQTSKLTNIDLITAEQEFKLELDFGSDSEHVTCEEISVPGYDANAIHNDAIEIHNDGTGPHNDLTEIHNDATGIDNNATAIGNDAFSSDNDTITLDHYVKQKHKLKRKKERSKEKSLAKKLKRLKKVKNAIIVKGIETKKLKKPKIKKSMVIKEVAALIKSCFDIKQLSYVEQIENIKKRQEMFNFKVAPYKCMQCYTGFLNEAMYENHMVQHTDARGSFQCDICKAHFRTKHLIRTHLGHGSHIQRYECRKCGLLTVYRNTARLHAEWHRGTSYECEHCKQRFTRQTTLMNHVRVKHACSCVCVLCGHHFVTESGLAQHRARLHRLDEHMAIAGPDCVPCDIRFASISAYNTHMNVSPNHVTENKIWSSNNAHTRLGRKECKKIKIQVPKPKKKIPETITCEQCGIQMESGKAYHAHFRRAHPDKSRTDCVSVKQPSMCEVCGRIFQSVSGYQNHHSVKHTGEKPFKCSECDKRFPNKLYLGMHMKRHVHKLCNVTYPCHLCGRTFVQAYNRDKHLKEVHSDARPFSCDVCGKAFKTKYAEKAHTDYVHLKKPWPKKKRQRETASVRASEINVEFES